MSGKKTITRMNALNPVNAQNMASTWPAFADALVGRRWKAMVSYTLRSRQMERPITKPSQSIVTMAQNRMEFMISWPYLPVMGL